MSDRPRVSARHETEALTLQMSMDVVRNTPAVLVEVSFDLHDHEAALADLDFAVARVREQIAETTK